MPDLLPVTAVIDTHTLRKPLTDRQRTWMWKVMDDFPVRAFGEEMARINFLPENSASKQWQK